MRIFVKVIFLGFCLSVAGQSYGQKVGLVLSGGGAKGLAHIGVIKALEEHEIPIDYIVGTSMGAIVGGCYAAGFSIEEIEAIVGSSKFQDWVNGRVDEEFEYFYYAKENNPSWLRFNLSLDSIFNARFATNLANDHIINFVFAEMFAQSSAKSEYDFDKLMVPFRSVAAEIFTQSTVVIDSGSLSSAVRASMSVPLFFQPIRRDGVYLFDGGIYNNFPVSVMQKEFDPEMIIGVNVASIVYKEYPYGEDDELLSNSLLRMLMDKSDPDLIPEDGIYIEPDLENFTAFDFSKAEELIALGYEVAIKDIEKIKEKIIERRPKAVVDSKRKAFKSDEKPWVFGDFSIHGYSKRQQQYIRRVFTPRAKELSLREIKTGYFGLVSDDYFKTVYPNIVYNEDTEVFDFEIHRRPQPNLNFEIGGTLATRNISFMYLGLDYYRFGRFLSNFRTNFYAGNFYKSMQARTRINMPVFYQFYLEPEITLNSWDYLAGDEIFLESRNPVVLRSIDRKYAVNFGLPLGSRFKLATHVGWINNTNRFSNENILSSADTLDVQRLNGIRVGTYISRSSLNRKQYPSRGKEYSLNLDYFSLREDYEPGNTSVTEQDLTNNHRWFRAKARIQQYFSTRPGYSFGYLLEGVFSNQPLFANYRSTIINNPEFFPLQDSRTIFLVNFRGQNFVAGGVRNVINVIPNLDFRLEGYVFKAFEQVVEGPGQTSVYDDLFSRINISATAGMVFHSPVGPISLSLNYYDDPNYNFGVLLHLGYLIFNRRSLD